MLLTGTNMTGHTVKNVRLNYLYLSFNFRVGTRTLFKAKKKNKPHLSKYFYELCIKLIN